MKKMLPVTTGKTSTISTLPYYQARAPFKLGNATSLQEPGALGSNASPSDGNALHNTLDFV